MSRISVSKKILYLLLLTLWITSCSFNSSNDNTIFDLKNKKYSQNIYYAWSTEELNKELFPAINLDSNMRQYNWNISTAFDLNANRDRSCLQAMIFLHRFYASNPGIIEPVLYIDKVYGHFEVYSHDHLIYSYPRNKNFETKNPPMHFIHVQPRWAVYDSHVVKFRFYPDGSGKMGLYGKVLFGSQGAILNKLLTDLLPFLIAGFLCILIFVVLLTITVVRFKKRTLRSLTIPLAFVFFLSSLLLFINKKILFIFLNISLPEVSSFFFLPILILLFFCLGLFIYRVVKMIKLKNGVKKEKKDLLLTYNITDREKEILQLVFQGKSSKEIGDTLFISPRTVDNHLYNIYQKTNTKNRVQLVKMLQDNQVF